MSVIQIEGLKHAWRAGVPVLDIDHLTIAAGEKVFLAGGSGSGKSTLLGLIAGVYDLQVGKVTVLDQELGAISAAKRDRLRADCFGVIFQQFNLVPYLSPLENVLLSARFSAARRAHMGGNTADQRASAASMLQQLGLDADEMGARKAHSLSVGQQQRVAAARALVGAPKLIIADEPTSALDSQARDRFIETLLQHAADAAVVFVSHDDRLATHFDRSIEMSDVNRATIAEAV